ncbi:hypothetical protein QOZ80_2BG0156690 [Eleusine coracana subsp. coracana]|nr:hypothetical protein QOZ80_2BG0156690 [Eleusine coracana subsp. coracana]
MSISSSAPTASLPPPQEAPPEPSRSLSITTAAAAGTPEVEADVVATSPRAVLDPGRLFACDVCGRRFHRVHNLHKHRRLHTTTTTAAASGKKEKEQKKRKVVFVCPEASCPRHDPAHGMPSFAGIKRHFLFHQKQRGTQAQQATRSVQVHRQQDTCSLTTRSADKESSSSLGVAGAGASSSCGDHLVAGLAGGDPDGVAAAASSRPSDPVFTPLPPPDRPVAAHDAELKFIPPREFCARAAAPSHVYRRAPPQHSLPAVPHLELSLWFGGEAQSQDSAPVAAAAAAAARRIKEEARERRRLATAELAAAEAVRAEARRQAELAQHDRAVAWRVRQQAQAELSFSATAHAVRSHAMIPPCCCFMPPVAAAATGSAQHGRPQQPWAPRSPAT